MISKKIAILGAGSWGTSVATLLAANNHNVTLWCFDRDVADSIAKDRVNKKYLPGVEISEKILPTASIKEAVDGAEIIFEAVPVLFLRETLELAKPYITKEQAWVILSKGIENSTLLFPSQIIKDVLDFLSPIVVLSGPTFAIQLAHQELSGALLASHDQALREKIGSLCANKFFTTQYSGDVIGAQVSSALKNVISLYIGMLIGAGYKENTIAMCLTNGFAELSKIVTHFGGKAETAYGLAGLGDLMLGLVGEKNRNCAAGVLLGEGISLSDLSSQFTVLPEGINTTKSLKEIIIRDNLVLPICSSVYDVIFEGAGVSP